MPSKHDQSEPKLTVRVPKNLKNDAQKELALRGLQMRSFVVACLTALTKNPGELFALLKPHWPPKKPHLGGGIAVKRFREQSGYDGQSDDAASGSEEGSTR
ncbi:hypothetical protein [Amycolatopsis sp. NPDC004079]|uniref:hypothetical protein n=1 Tax=Amycolatopsis sp. NPDC004079 TaxID=3154549 RepID=UPI0033B07DC8